MPPVWAHRRQAQLVRGRRKSKPLNSFPEYHGYLREVNEVDGMAEIGTLPRGKGTIVQRHCDVCGRLYETFKWKLARGWGRTCGGSCAAKMGARSRENKGPKWRKAPRETLRFNNGYKMRKVPSHPHADSQGYVMEHRLVAEMMLGRYLDPAKVVHHLDHDKTNNSPFNLAVFANNGDHIRFHLGNDDVKYTTFDPLPLAH